MLDAMRMLAGAAIASTPAAADERVARWSTLVAGDWLRTTLERIRQPDEAAGCQPGRDLQAASSPASGRGVQWLWFMTELGLGRALPMTWGSARRFRCSACCCSAMGGGPSISAAELLVPLR